MTNRLIMQRKSSIARAYSSFFVVASFFAEGTMAVPDALRARQDNPTPTSTSPSSIASPILAFIPFPTNQQAVTCESFEFDWAYSGEDVGPITFEATDAGVQQISLPFSTLPISITYNTDAQNVARAVPTGADSPLPIVTVTVATAISPQASSYVWSSVNVPQGQYMLLATFTNFPSSTYFAQSLPFSVTNGTDTSCLSTTIPSPTPSPTPTGTSQPITAPTTSSSGTALPIGGSSSSSSDSVGLIVGVSIAGAILLGLALGGWIWAYNRRRKTSKGGPAPAFRRWNGLGSTDSRGGLMGTNSRTHPRGESFGTLPMSPSEEAVAKSEKNSTHSKSGDANPFHDGSGQVMALSTLPVLHHDSAPQRNVGVSRSYSMSSSVSNHEYMPNEFGATHTGGRRPSVGESYTGRQSIESVTYPPSSPSLPGGLGRNSTMFIPSPVISRPESIVTSTTHQNYTGFASSGQSVSSHAGLLNERNLSPSPLSDHITHISPTSPCDPARQGGNRRSLGPTKRKPVPAYDDSAEVCTGPVPPLPASSTSSTPIPPSSPVVDYAPHYVTRSQAGYDQSQPNLVHKSSFGPGGVEGKALHYLIPDPPMAPNH